MYLVLVWLALGASTFDVDVTGPRWQASALRAALVADLASDQLTPAPRGELHVAIGIGERTLRYTLSRDGVPPVRGEIALGVNRRDLAGVLKDELHRLVPHAAAVADASLEMPAAAPGILAALAALLILPIVLARRRMRATPRLVAGIAALGAGAFALEYVADGAIYAAGGLAWGGAVAALVPRAFPSLAGLHRVEHRELGVVLRAWLALAAQRSLGLALWLVPLGIGLAWIGPVMIVVILPLTILTGRLAWRALVELAAARLDAKLVANDAWHAQIQGYLVGYLRRANLDVDDELLARMRFFAGTEPERVAVYGGGLTHTRVVVGQAMLERALAPYGRPHDYARPRVSTLHWTHWNAGLVMPTATDEALASRADREPRVAHVEAAEHERIALGEPPTLTGVIEPVAFDPRTRYRPDEDPLWLDWDPGEEHDGTDPGDKDFLFGVLVTALGIAQRHEDRAATFALAFPWLARVRLPFATRLGDLHAVLGGARHHLAQYLAWQRWQREDLLTARAYVPQLEARSRQILAVLDRDPDDDPAHDRLRALRRFIDPRAVIQRSPRQRLVLAIGVIVACAAVAALAVQAALYHSTYEERHRSDGKRS